MFPPPLSHERVYLRPLAVTDAQALHEPYADPAVCRYWSRPAHTSLAQTEAAVAWEIGNGWSWVLVPSAHAPGGDAVGRISLFPGQSKGVHEIGVILAQRAWGQRLASAALDCVIRYAFEELGAHRLSADVDPDNEASLRLFERAGFLREGHLRHAWRTHLGLRDSVILGRLAPPK